MSAQHFIDSLEFAEQSLEIHDKIRASNLPGLVSVVSQDAGELDYRLTGGRAARGRLTLRLTVDGELRVICQRCLSDMRYAVSIDRMLVLVADESALPDEEYEDDDADYLVADSKLDVAALVEEEVLLSLPFAMTHDDCAGEMPSASIGKPNPFQVLEGLKKK